MLRLSRVPQGLVLQASCRPQGEDLVPPHMSPCAPPRPPWPGPSAPCPWQRGNAGGDHNSAGPRSSCSLLSSSKPLARPPVMGEQGRLGHSKAEMPCRLQARPQKPPAERQNTTPAGEGWAPEQDPYFQVGRETPRIQGSRCNQCRDCKSPVLLRSWHLGQATEGECGQQPELTWAGLPTVAGGFQQVAEALLLSPHLPPCLSQACPSSIPSSKVPADLLENSLLRNQSGTCGQAERFPRTGESIYLTPDPNFWRK